MTATTPERAQEILGDLAERGYALACKLQDQAMAAEDPEATARLARAFHHTARAVRQTLALHARLGRDEAAGSAQTTRTRVEARRTQVATAMRRLIDHDHDGPDAENLLDEVEERLEEEALYEGFLDEPVEAHIERIRKDLGLSGQPPRHWTADDADAAAAADDDDLADPWDEDDADAPALARRSSA